LRARSRRRSQVRHCRWMADGPRIRGVSDD
jgi:hypothetical protein